MHFKRLELFGFKSFADKTVIHFEPGVTSIVGPNGCGKSNISDSIRWVLGEQSAKSLRGSSMEDVIFNGSGSKDALNLAEVSLTLSNECKTLPIEYDEVTISRKLYRNGDSEYLLNNNVVRLKDIHQLLMGTGIGTESYSIIEQGKMDQILNSKPEDRREIFEEAAGITKFKSQKKEATRKLEQTDANLLRVNDIILEVKRQIGSMERQAKKAEAYKKEFEKLRNLELSVARREFMLFEDRKQEKEREFHALKDKEEESQAVVDAIENKYREKRFELGEIEENVRRFESEEMMIHSDMRRDQDRLLLNRERIGEMASKKESLFAQIESAKVRIAELEHQSRSFEDEISQAHDQEKSGFEFLSSVENEFSEFDNQLNAIAQEQAQAEAALDELLQSDRYLSSQIAKLQAEIAATDTAIQKLRAEEGSLLQEIRQINESLSLPLFAATAEEASAQEGSGFSFESKLREFKSRVVALFKKVFARQSAELSGEEETEFDAEIKIFTDEVLKAQGQIKDRQNRIWHFEENRKKCEQRLALIATEISQAESEMSLLRDHANRVDSERLALADNLRASEARIEELSGRLQEKNTAKEALLMRLAETRQAQGQFSSRREKIDKDRQWLEQSKQSEERRVLDFQREIEESVSKKETLEQDCVGLDENIARLAASRDEILIQVENVRRARQSVQSELDTFEKEKNEAQAFLKTASEKVHAIALESAQIIHEIDRLKDRIFNAYQVDILVQSQMQETQENAAEALAGQEESSAEAEFDMEAAKTEIAAQKDKLTKMGPVNLVAIEEYEELKTRYEFLTKQQADLLQAKDDLHKAILKINKTTKEMFAETFEKVQKNFSEYFKILFGGGQAELVLLDATDILECGVEIIARPPGKKLQSITLMSGGEKALTAVALMFSLFKVKPSPFCILDEIDAPLDESNVDRFCKALQEFITGSQFIIITHNKRTMSLAHAMYGITMEQTGVSRVVSVKFEGKEDKVMAPGEPSASLV